MTIAHTFTSEDGQYTKTIEVSNCKCGREPTIATRWQTKKNDPSTEIPIAYYIGCGWCDLSTHIVSCKKAKTPEERFKIIEKVAEEWNELVNAT